MSNENEIIVGMRAIFYIQYFILSNRFQCFPFTDIIRLICSSYNKAIITSNCHQYKKKEKTIKNDQIDRQY